MTPAELAASAVKAIADRLALDKAMGVPPSAPSAPHVTLFLDRQRSSPSSNTMRLFGKGGGPRGEIVSDVEDGTLVAFKAHDILEWLTSRGVVSVRVRDDGAVEITQLVDRELPA